MRALIPDLPPVQKIAWINQAQLDSYAMSYGHTVWLGLAPNEKEAFARRATQFIDSYETRFTGERKTATQALAWSRMNATVGGIALVDDAIPGQVQRGTCEAAMILAEGDELFPIAGAQIKTETVSVLTTEFFETDNPSTAPTVDAILAPVLKNNGLCSIPVRMG